MKKTAFLLMIITIVSKVFGFAREIALSYFYGASEVSDAYLVSLTIPTVIFAFIGTAISTGYIPMYSRIEKNNGSRAAARFTNNLINTMILLCTVFALLGVLFTNQLVKAFASGFEGETLALAARFTRWAVFGIYFTGIVYILSGFLQIKGNYAIPALIGFPYNFIIILSIFLSTRIDVQVLAIGSVAAIASQFFLVAPFAFRKGYSYSPVLNVKDEHMKNILYLALPILLGVTMSQANVLVDRTIASRIALGGISALNYANRLNGFVQGLFVVTITTVMYPMISRMAADKNMPGLKKTLSEAINLVNLLVVPVTVGAMIFAEPVVKLLFGRGAFDASAVSMTSSALFFYSIGMVGYGLRDVLSRAFYSLEDTKTPVINGAIAMGLNIVLIIILSKFMGLGGLALATSISAIFCTALLLLSLRKKIGPFGMRNVIVSFAKMLGASLVMGLLAKVLFGALAGYFGGNVALLLSIAAGAGAYFIMICMAGIPEVEGIIRAVKEKIGWQGRT